MSAATEQGDCYHGHHEFFCALFLLLLLLFYPKKVIAICAAENSQELKGLSQNAARIAVRRYFIIRRCYAMIAILKNGTTPSQIQHLVDWLKNMNLDVHISEGSEVTILGLVGDTSRVDIDLLKSLEMVETVKRVSEPFKQANRKFHPKDTIIEAGNARIGGGYFAMIAGPCSVESEEQIIAVASAVKESGASILRGGAFKPRTSPYAFQGMKGEGIRLLLEAKKATGLPIVTEIMNISTLDLFADVDIIQVGARNMQNFDLLKELGKTDKPILLKRGLANTLQELLMSAEYIMSEGNSKVILCERGIRTFETATRNTLDLSAVPVLHNLTHLPVVVDPSHATGKADLVAPMAYAATAAGADGIMVEVHNDPAHALCDGAQSITPPQFDEISRKVRQIREVLV
jgi:3-deoxy-7-phosphoheptulonate synthase